MNKDFLIKQFSNILIRQTSQNIKIRKIEAKVHDSFEFVKINVYIAENTKDDPKIEHLKAEFHLIEDLKAKILIEMNIMKSENIIFDFDRKFMTIPTCKNLETTISIQKKNPD